MSHYVISISPDEVGHEYRVLLRGPGIDSDGHRYIFATTHRCAAFAEAVNFATSKDCATACAGPGTRKGDYCW